MSSRRLRIFWTCTNWPTGMAQIARPTGQPPFTSSSPSANGVRATLLPNGIACRSTKVPSTSFRSEIIVTVSPFAASWSNVATLSVPDRRIALITFHSLICRLLDNRHIRDFVIQKDDRGQRCHRILASFGNHGSGCDKPLATYVHIIFRQGETMA
ncbi:hypothetical protein ElyMa_006386000 [Elysia marginata]|uniref:Uncharacterized protein n=1 Tax=Elysia marginata TaxID=1093978 RepID=A0AAV4HQG6_9GAST|nr:hypothetical protein ElyMa_006386000 [Elysia marginata]